MRTITTGVFIVKKQRPQIRQAIGADPFRLVLSVFDRQTSGARDRLQDYLVAWSGQAAATWWREHGEQLTPGTPLLLELEDPHAENLGAYLGCEIRARVRRLELAPRANSIPSKPASSTPAQPQEIHPHA